MGCSSSKDVVGNSNKPQPQQSSVKSQQTKIPNIKHSYEHIDAHARKAPNSLKNSIEDLVSYLSSPSKEPRMQVRAFFVWMSENIKYDADGYFGRAERSPCDALSVMKYGKSVCEGYANVMEALCRQANINVKKISGYAKGVGHSEDHVITTSESTNHAWNAVEIGGQWYLVDATWGAGHINNQNEFQKEFEEFYFLTNPEKLINTHFPYMNNNMEESMKWQLLKKPVTLEEFNKKVRRWPKAYEVGVQPISHPNGLIEANGPIEMVFQIDGKEDVLFTEHLMIYEENMIREIKYTVFGERHGDKYKVKIHPPRVGKYGFTLYGKRGDKEGSFPQLFKYLVLCKKASDPDFRYPQTYTQTQTDLCILHEPVRNNLPANSRMNISLSSPVLTRVMINQEFLTKTGDKFEGAVTTGQSGSRLGVYGSRVGDGSLGGLYVFDIN